jgi:hypothetical protein
MDIVVIQKDGCTFDMVLMTGVDVFRERDPDFDLFVQGFMTMG